MKLGRKPRSEKASKPVQASWQLTVEGGLLKVPTVVGSVKEHYKGRVITFVTVTAITPWLCEMVNLDRCLAHLCKLNRNSLGFTQQPVAMLTQAPAKSGGPPPPQEVAPAEAGQVFAAAAATRAELSKP